MGWNQRQALLIELLADVTDARPKAEKSKAAGYSEKQVFRLQREPEFREAVLKRMRELLGVALPVVYQRLYSIARDGRDRDAIRACDSLLKAAGEIASTMSQVVNVQQDAGEREETLQEAIKRVSRERWEEYRRYDTDATPEQPNNNNTE